MKLLALSEHMGLEGIVSNGLNSAYRAGPTHDWIKVKTADWREATRDRHELFDMKRP